MRTRSFLALTTCSADTLWRGCIFERQRTKMVTSKWKTWAMILLLWPRECRMLAGNPGSLPLSSPRPSHFPWPSQRRRPWNPGDYWQACCGAGGRLHQCLRLPSPPLLPCNQHAYPVRLDGAPEHRTASPLQETEGAGHMTRTTYNTWGGWFDQTRQRLELVAAGPQPGHWGWGRQHESLVKDEEALLCPIGRVQGHRGHAWGGGDRDEFDQRWGRWLGDTFLLLVTTK